MKTSPRRIYGTSVAQMLLSRSAAYPFATNLSLITIPIGLGALVIGPAVSRAFTIVFDSPAVIYFWGVWMVLGGLNVAWGVLRNTPSIERAGMFVLFLPLSFYGACVMIGLGRGGLVTGPVFCVLSISCLQRARIIHRAATAGATLAAAAEAAGEDAATLTALQDAAVAVLQDLAHGSRDAHDSAVDAAQAKAEEVLAREAGHFDAVTEAGLVDEGPLQPASDPSSRPRRPGPAGPPR